MPRTSYEPCGSYLGYVKINPFNPFMHVVVENDQTYFKNLAVFAPQDF